MLNSECKITLQKTPSLYLGYTAIIAMITTIISSIWSFFDSDVIIALIGVVSLTIFLLICIFYAIIYLRTEYFVNTAVNQQYPENLDSLNTIHDAFVLIHSMGGNGIVPGLDNLIAAFKAKGYPFKIYHCYTKEDFKVVLANENAKYVWIFGHGWRGGITFKWKPSITDILHLKRKKQTNFQYSDLIDDQITYPSKDFIAQLHCNHIAKKSPSNISLPEILMGDNITPEMYHVSDYYNNPYSVWFTTRKLVRSINRSSILSGNGGKQ